MTSLGIKRLASVVLPRYRTLWRRQIPTVSLPTLSPLGINRDIRESRFSSSAPKPQKDKVSVTFLLRSGETEEVKATVGDNLLDVIIDNDVDIDGFGACEGTLACSTCHLIFKQEDYTKIPDPPTDEELDMLDLAYGLTETSRLGCQVIVTKDMDGLQISVPKAVADARSGPL